MIVNKDEVKKLPVVVIGPPRSGSSVICRQLTNDLNILGYNDVTYSPDKTEFDKFSKLIQSTNEYVIKFHAADLINYPKFLLDKINNRETYNIKIVRQDKVAQLASVYLAEIRKTYTYDRLNLDMYADEIIKIEKIRLAGCLKRMHKNYTELEELTVIFDKVVNYEDYVYDLGTAVITPKPKNYNELINIIENWLENYIW
jgi:hypothetical protein